MCLKGIYFGTQPVANVVDLKLGPFVCPTFYDLLDSNLHMRSRYSEIESIKGLQVGVFGAQQGEVLAELGQNLLLLIQVVCILFIPYRYQ